MADDITIDLLHTAQEMASAVRLQQTYWGEDMSAIVPEHMLLSIARYGGHVHGAFDDGKMVGMLLGFLGADIDPAGSDNAPERLLIMSKRMVVLPEYRGRKIGERLKLAQRDYAIQHNIPLVTWTFDPLLSRNAYLNLRKLAGIGQEYKLNYFGSAAADPTLSGDRLVVNWWVQHPTTTEKLQAEKPPISQGRCINQVSLGEGGYLVPTTLMETLPEYDTLTVEIPREFVPLERNKPSLAQQWRDHVRQAFVKLLEGGYLATDFITMKQTPAADDSPFADERLRSYYVFTRDDGSYAFGTVAER